MSGPTDQGEKTYLGAAISISKGEDGRVWLRRDPPGITTIMQMDALVLMELVSWVEDNMPEVIERLRKHTVRPTQEFMDPPAGMAEDVPRDPLTGDVRNARDLDKEPNSGLDD